MIPLMPVHTGQSSTSQCSGNCWIGTARSPLTGRPPTFSRRCSPASAQVTRLRPPLYVCSQTFRRPWIFCYHGAFGSVGSFRYGRPRDTSPAPVVKLQHTRFRLTVVPVIFARPNSARSPLLSQIFNSSLGLRCRPTT